MSTLAASGSDGSDAATVADRLFGGQNATTFNPTLPSPNLPAPSTSSAPQPLTKDPTAFNGPGFALNTGTAAPNPTAAPGPTAAVGGALATQAAKPLPDTPMLKASDFAQPPPAADNATAILTNAMMGGTGSYTPGTPPAPAAKSPVYDSTAWDTAMAGMNKLSQPAAPAQVVGAPNPATPATPPSLKIPVSAADSAQNALPLVTDIPTASVTGAAITATPPTGPKVSMASGATDPFAALPAPGSNPNGVDFASQHGGG